MERRMYRYFLGGLYMFYVRERIAGVAGETQDHWLSTVEPTYHTITAGQPQGH